MKKLIAIMMCILLSFNYVLASEVAVEASGKISTQITYLGANALNRTFGAVAFVAFLPLCALVLFQPCLGDSGEYDPNKEISDMDKVKKTIIDVRVNSVLHSFGEGKATLLIVGKEKKKGCSEFSGQLLAVMNVKGTYDLYQNENENMNQPLGQLIVTPTSMFISMFQDMAFTTSGTDGYNCAWVVKKDTAMAFDRKN